MNTDTFKRRLDKWVKPVLDEPRIDNKAICVTAKNNSIAKHVIYWLCTTC